MKTYVCVYLISGFLSMAVTPIVIRLARRIGALDRGSPRAVHRTPVPRIGGVAIFCSAVVTIISVVFLDNRIGDAFQDIQWRLTALLCTSAFVFLVGLVDDLRRLPPQVKLAAEVAAVGVLCLAGVRIDSIATSDHLMLHLGAWGCLLTIFWIVGITNAVNLSDGLDGLAAGVSAVACGIIAIIALRSEQSVMVVFMLALMGSLSGFLVFNFHPAKVFLGDCGSLFLGFTIAAASVMCVTKSATLIGLALPVLALGIPIFDTLSSMLRRFLEGRSLFAPDRNHFHHRLLDLGLQQRQAVILIYLATLAAAGLGLFMLLRKDIGSLVIFGCVLLLIGLLFRVVGAVRLRATLAGLQEKIARSHREHQDRRTFEHMQLCLRQVPNAQEWWRTVCEAAHQLELAWISLRVTRPDGGMDTSIWRRPDTPAGFTRIVTVNFPLNRGPGDESIEFEIGVLIYGSLESANRRAALFTRLIDESTSRRSYPITSGFESQIAI